MDPYTHRRFRALSDRVIEEVLTALTQGDHAEAGHLLAKALNESAATPATPRASSTTPPVESRTSGEGMAYLSLVRELAGWTP